MLLYYSGHLPAKYVVINKVKRAGLKPKIISCIQIFLHCFIVFTMTKCRLVVEDADRMCKLIVGKYGHVKCES